MKATRKHQRRTRKSSDRLLGLLCAVLLLALAGGCGDEGPATTVGQGSEATAETADEIGGSPLASLRGDVEGTVEEPDETAGNLASAGQETGVE